MEEKVCWKLGMGDVMREGPLSEKKTLHEDKRDGGMWEGRGDNRQGC
jgi:hypothetical protein